MISRSADRIEKVSLMNVAEMSGFNRRTSSRAMRVLFSVGAAKNRREKDIGADGRVGAPTRVPILPPRHTAPGARTHEPATA